MDFSDLHSTQKQIVEEGDGVVIVNAGPGTGKTKTLTSRVVYLIQTKHIHPQNILTLIFTNRAAAEMKERLATALDVLPTVTTFHGFCYDLLKNWGEEFTIIEEEVKEKIIKKIIIEQKAKISSRDLSTRITQVKNGVSQSTVVPELDSLINRYNEELAKQTLVDFDDLLIKTVAIIQSDDGKRNELKKKYSHILIDEFQDSNDIQYKLISLVLNDPKNLFVIGDPLQSIYAFRGANPTIFDTLKRDYSDVKETSLQINYRSSGAVVELSKCIFPGVAKIAPHSQNCGQVALIETLNEYSEADWIINCINEKIGGTELLNAHDDGVERSIDFSDFAIIYRTHATAYSLEKRLQESGFPYQVVKEDSELEGHRIKLLSMHAAKGLEFNHVFICGFEDGLIPHTRKKASIKQEELEEEKRLLYVAMTRAKSELYLLYTRNRNKKKTSLSRFHTLLISDQLIKIVDPMIEKILTKQKHNALKKSQISLF